ncbi:hypothetical protein L228DRAFT_279860 [Xylona heveae TC161]|uniref:Zn(2)-C6 fungal-type domain-containing protein n=1 Tax=Xylona heveae (strain CBS 132557 / TC161) TaxID=1328760 RepID=A0A165JVN4_XYLHT|nr:hypothetical protein L228DRAFT_279860 [Xylona heveae TC161]KZF26689.1 hypothetical protein L228DRAFT_279860 [Xylona heveae TC161]
MAGSSSNSKDSAGFRVSQRRPLACQECTRRKVKCDKKIPCSRCYRLGCRCIREKVRLSNASSKHRGEIDFLKNLTSQLELAGNSVINGPVKDVKRRIAMLEHGYDEEEASTEEPVESPRTPNNGQIPAPRPAPMGLQPRAADFSYSEDPSSSQTGGQDGATRETATMVTALEYLAWGRHYGACYPHRHCSCGSHRSQSEMISINSDSNSIHRPFSAMLKDESILPPPPVASKLVQFHINHVVWHHNSLHSPTFLEQCESYWQYGTCDHPLWMALYLSVVSTALYSVQNSRRFQATLDIEIGDTAARDLFRAMVDVLYSENFMENLSLYSVQAIVISTEVAHNLGLSELNATLFSAAVRIAQCLGLHQIAEPESLVIQTTEQWHETIEREVGKRVWCQLIIQDHFAFAFTDSYIIHPSQYSTSLPMNCDDHDLIPKESSLPTISSYVRTLASVAALMPELADGLAALRGKNLQEQYEHVIRLDHRMRKLVGEIPPFLLRENPGDGMWTPWLDIARRSLAITAAEKIIMIHRPFLFQSFQSSQYSYTRNTCISAAMTILREHEKITETDDISIWTHSAFCVTAAMILCLELMYRQQYDDERGQLYRALVVAAKDRLAARRGDVLAQRGVTLIETILLEEATAFDPSIAADISAAPHGRKQSGRAVNFHNVMANFLVMNNAVFGKDHGNYPEQGDFADSLLGMNDDFNLWFDQIFGVVGPE